MRTEPITWKVRCPLCKKYVQKEKFHALAVGCDKCRAKQPIVCCCAITERGTRCQNIAKIRGYCMTHLKTAPRN